MDQWIQDGFVFCYTHQGQVQRYLSIRMVHWGQYPSLNYQNSCWIKFKPMYFINGECTNDRTLSANQSLYFVSYLIWLTHVRYDGFILNNQNYDLGTVSNNRKGTLSYTPLTQHLQNTVWNISSALWSHFPAILIERHLFTRDFNMILEPTKEFLAITIL